MDFKKGTLENQLKNIPKDMPIRPQMPLGYLQRKRFGMKFPEDKKYIEELRQYELDLKIYLNPKYNDLKKEYDSIHRNYSLDYYIENRDKIMKLEKRGLLRYEFIKSGVKHYFKKYTGVEFIETEESLEYLNLLIDFHFITERQKPFIESNLIIKEVNIGKTIELPLSLNKGLLIVANTGVGKTALINSIMELSKPPFRKVKDINGEIYELQNFKQQYRVPVVVSARELNRIERDDKEQYAKLLNYYNIWVDDVLSEDHSFGRYVFSDFIEERYKLKNITSIIVNYEGTFENTLNVLSNRYGKRFDSRMFEMFNFVALKEKDKRIKVKDS